MNSPLEQLVALRLRLCASPPPSGPAVEAFLSKVYGPLLSSASNVERFEVAGQLAGVLVVTAPQPNRFGPPEAAILALLDPEEPSAQVWAGETLDHLAGTLVPHCSLDLRPTDRALLGRARAHGFGVAKIDLVGDVQTARRRLGARTRGALPGGIEIRPLTAPVAESVAQMLGAYFREHPAVGWGGLPPTNAEQAEIDRREAERMRDRLTHGPLTDYVVLQNGALVGHLSCVFRDHALYGPSGGMNLFLASEVQGMGLGVQLYLHLLDRLHALGAKTYFGRTSNPAVIHLGRVMGRRLERLILRRDEPFLGDDAWESWPSL